MERRRPGLRALGWVHALVTVGVLTLWWTVGDTAWTALLNLGTFWWSLPGVVLLVLALLLRDRRAAALFALPAAVWVWSYTTAFVGGDPSAGADLRVVSFNTYVHTEGEEHVLDLVAETEPDVLVLQEVFPAREEVLREELGDTFPEVHVDQSPRVGGVGVWSRYPIVETTVVDDASDVSRTTSVVTIDVDGRPVQVVPVHLISPCPSCGPSVIERLELEGEVRRAEIGAVLDALEPGVPVVLAGDLNSNERSVAYRTLVDAGFRDPQREAGRGPGFTWPADGRLPPVLRIDWILVRGFAPVDAYVPDARGSDHRPVVADLVFAPETEPEA